MYIYQHYAQHVDDGGATKQDQEKAKCEFLAV